MFLAATAAALFAAATVALFWLPERQPEEDLLRSADHRAAERGEHETVPQLPRRPLNLPDDSATDRSAPPEAAGRLYLPVTPGSAASLLLRQQGLPGVTGELRAQQSNPLLHQLWQEEKAAHAVRRYY